MTDKRFDTADAIGKRGIAAAQAAILALRFRALGDKDEAQRIVQRAEAELAESRCALRLRDEWLGGDLFLATSDLLDKAQATIIKARRALAGEVIA